MQTKLLILVVMSFFCFGQFSFAGFIKNRRAVIPENVAGAEMTSRVGVGDSIKMNSRTRCFNQDYRYRARRREHYGEGGWAGVVSYLCSCTVILCVPAVIFGAIGLSRRRRNRYWAVKGFVYGIISTVLLAAIFISILLI